MAGHGWVTPLPGGAKARCGGPAICAACAVELARKEVPVTTITAAEALPGDILLDSTGTAWQRGLEHFIWSTFAGPIGYYGPWEPEYGPQGNLTLLVRDGQPVT